jgi:hypothetical protein
MEERWECGGHPTTFFQPGTNMGSGNLLEKINHWLKKNPPTQKGKGETQREEVQSQHAAQKWKGRENICPDTNPKPSP